MEQRHGAVADVLGAVAVGRTRRLGDAGEPALGAAHRLGRPRRPRGEEQEQQVVLSDGSAVLDRPAEGDRVDEVDLLGGRAEVEALEHRPTLVVGEDELAVGGPDVGGQHLASPGGVDADDGPAGAGGAEEPEQVVDPVGQQDPDVGRGLGASGVEPGGAAVGFVDHLVPRKRATALDESRVGIPAPGLEEVGEGRHQRAGRTSEGSRSAMVGAPTSAMVRRISRANQLSRPPTPSAPPAARA